MADLSERFKNEVKDAEWDKQFSDIESSMKSHHDKLFDTLFLDVWKYSPLWILLHFLADCTDKQRPALLFMIKLTFGYRRRCARFHQLIAQEESAAARFAIPQETKWLRDQLKNPPA